MPACLLVDFLKMAFLIDVFFLLLCKNRSANISKKSDVKKLMGFFLHLLDVFVLLYSKVMINKGRENKGTDKLVLFK